MRRARRRAGVEPRRVARQRTMRHLLSWATVVTLSAGVIFIVTFLVGAQALLGLTGHHWGSGLFGFLFGVLLASLAWTMWGLVTSTDGSWAWRVGEQAERSTSQALGHLGGRWRFQYNMVFVGGGVEGKTWVTDIECVATGPYGVLAVSTKWTSDPWDLNNPQDEWLVAAAKQASRNATRLRRQVRHCVPDAPVVPLVVCWGPQLAPIERGVSQVPVEGAEVLVVYGPQSREWLATFDTECLGNNEISAINGLVGAFIDRYEDLNARTTNAKSGAKLAARRSVWATRAGVAVTICAIAWMVAAALSRPVLTAWSSFLRFGDGTIGTLYILVPTALLIGSAVFAVKANSWGQRARLKTNSNLVLIESLVGLGVWVMTLVLVSIAR